jgi:hypothetical protein
MMYRLNEQGQMVVDVCCECGAPATSTSFLSVAGPRSYCDEHTPVVLWEAPRLADGERPALRLLPPRDVSE